MTTAQLRLAGLLTWTIAFAIGVYGLVAGPVEFPVEMAAIGLAGGGGLLFRRASAGARRGTARS